MSHIGELIEKYCPTGVSVVPLGEVGEFIRGNGMQKSDLREEGFAAIHYGQIHTHYGISAHSSKSFVEFEFATKLRQAQPGDLLIVTTSEDDQSVAKATAWLGETNVALSGDAFIYRHTLDPRFMSYFFDSKHFQEQKKRYISGTKVRRISGTSLAKILIPVPPLEVQCEIVRILDEFSKLESELQSELKSELKAREKQYDFYCGQLLEEELLSESISIVKIGEICGLNRGSVISKDYLSANPGKYPVYSSQTANEGIFGYIDSYAFDDNESITWTTDGAKAGSVFYHQHKKFNITNVCGRLISEDKRVRLKYVYFQLKFRAKRFVHAGMGNPKLMANHMRMIPIPLPSLEKQDQVVNTLSKFDALVNDLSIGLSAELNARRKQYEHYRDQLLAFEELAS